MHYYLLSDNNPKTDKSLLYGWKTLVLHLAPARESGYQVCPASTKACREGCLNRSGRGHMAAIQGVRKRRTRLYFLDRPRFLALLQEDIRNGLDWAKRRGVKLAVRLNGTSDIRWERHRRHLMDAFPDVQFYDYTKLYNRGKYSSDRNAIEFLWPDNYQLTFSLSDTNRDKARQWLQGGGNVAVIFRGEPFPKTYMGHPVLNGETNDLRFLDPPGHIVALRWKQPRGLERAPKGLVQLTSRRAS